MTRAATWRAVRIVGAILLAVPLFALIVMLGAASSSLGTNQPDRALQAWPLSAEGASRVADRMAAQGDAAGATALAIRALSRAPQDARGLRAAAAAASAAGDGTTADAAMALAARLGWRDGPTQRWVLQRALAERQYATAAQAGDAMLRTDYDAPDAYAGLGRLLDSDGGRAAIAQQMAIGAPWAGEFMQQFRAVTPDQRVRFAELLAQLDQSGVALGGLDLSSYFLDMIGKGDTGQAITLWHQFNPGAEGDPTAGIVDGDFAQLSRGIGGHGPFGWRARPSGNVEIDFSARGELDNDHSLDVQSYSDRRRPIVTQLMALRPGRYVLTFESRQTRGEDGGFSIELRCNVGGRQLGKPERRAASGAAWAGHRLAFEVPASGCAGQTLTLLGGQASDDGVAASFDSFRIAPAG